MIPSKWPDVELWAINLLRPILTGATVANQKPATTAPYKHLLLDAALGTLETPITRTCRLNLEGWSIRQAGTARLAEARQLVSDAAFAIESAVATTPWLITASIDTGPTRAQDAIGDPEFLEASLVLTVLRIS